MYNKATGNQIDVSRLFIYYNSRLKNLPLGSRPTDSGSAIAYAVESLSEVGVCLEDLWTYDARKVNAKPSPECYSAASDHMIVEALEIDIDLFEMKACLAQGFPILISINVYGSFDDAKPKGIVPIPKANEVLRTKHGR